MNYVHVKYRLGVAFVASVGKAFRNLLETPP